MKRKKIVRTPRKKDDDEEDAELDMKEKKIFRLGGKKEKRSMNYLIAIIIAITVAGAAYYFYRSIIISAASLVSAIAVVFVYIYFSKSLKKAARIKKIEDVFPDFLQLMASNLRAGMTIDRAMLLSSRPEFFPLDEEILKTGKDITTGKMIDNALLDMSERIKSEKIHKVMLLVISGINAGGDIAVLLEETAVYMREREFVEKRAGGNVMMYTIFVFIAVAFGAPVLFSLSSILVGVLTNLLSGLPTVEASVNVPFTLSSINISPMFVTYFSLAFIIMIDIFASLVLGLVSKGEEREGMRYLPVIIIVSLVIFFLVKFALSGFLSNLF